MNDRNPAAKAASSVTFWSSLDSFQLQFDDLDFMNGIRSERRQPRRPSNLTGGRSWNMKSHFQRSDGLDACSQCFAPTPAARTPVARAPRSAALLAQRRARSPRARPALLACSRRAAPSASPTLTKICQSSCASPGGAIARAAACRRPSWLT